MFFLPPTNGMQKEIKLVLFCSLPTLYGKFNKYIHLRLKILKPHTIIFLALNKYWLISQNQIRVSLCSILCIMVSVFQIPLPFYVVYKLSHFLIQWSQPIRNKDRNLSQMWNPILFLYCRNSFMCTVLHCTLILKTFNFWIYYFALSVMFM